MSRFRKKPIVIEAIQYNKPGDHPEVEYGLSTDGKPNAIVKGKQGWVHVHPGDWIIEELDGSGHYPCKPDVFAATYEPVD